jgi:hypothetical protein
MNDMDVFAGFPSEQKFDIQEMHADCKRSLLFKKKACIMKIMYVIDG